MPCTHNYVRFIVRSMDVCHIINESHLPAERPPTGLDFMNNRVLNIMETSVNGALIRDYFQLWMNTHLMLFKGSRATMFVETKERHPARQLEFKSNQTEPYDRENNVGNLDEYESKKKN